MTPARPEVTVIVNFRERWSLTPQAIQSLIDNTSSPYQLWLLDSGMPTALRQEVERLGSLAGLRIIDVGHETWPNHARSMVVREITTPYAAFVDNDLVVAPGWLDKLVECAEQTGAGIVGPLYLWGKDGRSDLIHMAGGDLVIEDENGRRVMRESHRHFKAHLADLERELVRERCGFAEFHCMLMRREVFSAPDIFDPEIFCVHEHIHASLVASKLGYDTWLEPAARVNYLAFSPWCIGDIPRFRRRWSLAAAERSLRRFRQRWNVIDDERSMGGVRGFLHTHLSHVDPVDPRQLAADTRNREMQTTDLQQTLAGLLWLAQRNGYAGKDLVIMATGFHLAMELGDGIFRPCGRPFLNHLAGTASVLVHFGFALPVVLAGLLHSALSHGSTRRSADADRKILGMFARLGPPAQAVTTMVLGYDRRASTYAQLEDPGIQPETLSAEIGVLLLLEAANDIDMHLSLEVAASNRNDVRRGRLLELMLYAAAAVELPAMARTLVAVREMRPELPSIKFQSEGPGSFRFSEGKMVSAVRRP